MVPYCRFCDTRCFVLRRVPDDACWRPGLDVLMATCLTGMAHDRERMGYDHTTAIKPARSSRGGPVIPLPLSRFEGGPNRPSEVGCSLHFLREWAARRYTELFTQDDAKVISALVHYELGDNAPVGPSGPLESLRLYVVHGDSSRLDAEDCRRLLPYAERGASEMHAALLAERDAAPVLEARLIVGDDVPDRIVGQPVTSGGAVVGEVDGARRLSDGSLSVSIRLNGPLAELVEGGSGKGASVGFSIPEEPRAD